MTIATLVALLVFVGAAATALGTIAATVTPRLHRIRIVLAGVRPPLSPRHAPSPIQDGGL